MRGGPPRFAVRLVSRGRLGFELGAPVHDDAVTPPSANLPATPAPAPATPLKASRPARRAPLPVRTPAPPPPPTREWRPQRASHLDRTRHVDPWRLRTTPCRQAGLARFLGRSLPLPWSAPLIACYAIGK